MISIRQISDPILHQKPFQVDFDNADHLNQVHSAITIMCEHLHQTGGVGIASNQCTNIINPPQIFIVGTNNPAAAQRRYPGKVIPSEIIMINPTIIDYAGPYYPECGEGCLSVKGSMRARILRYQSITVEYFDIHGNKHTQIFQDFFAHITQHEYDHLQGLVYLQKAIQELNQEQIEQLWIAITHKSAQFARDTQSPLLVMERDTRNQIYLILSNLKIAVSETEDITLDGIKIILQQKLNDLQNSV